MYYEEKWVLATLKRRLVEMSHKGKDREIWYANEAAKVMLGMLAEIEADAILGTPEIVGDTVNKIINDDGNEDTCESSTESEVE